MFKKKYEDFRVIDKRTYQRERPYLDPCGLSDIEYDDVTTYTLRSVMTGELITTEMNNSLFDRAFGKATVIRYQKTLRGRKFIGVFDYHY